VTHLAARLTDRILKTKLNLADASPDDRLTDR